jgi:acyl-coenzyme A thioesterase PaaI-like protein
MTDTAHDTAPNPRAAGVLLTLCGAAALALLATHPGEPASSALVDVLRAEAAHAAQDAIVHGGFILVLALQLAGLIASANVVGSRKMLVAIGFCLLLVGSGLLSSSMIADGFMTPAVSARYLAAPPEKQEAARGALVLIGAAVGALMPMGLIFHGLSTLSFSAALIPLGARARLGGLAALATGAAMLACAVVSLATHTPALLMAALAALIAWILASGLTLIFWRAGPSTP